MASLSYTSMTKEEMRTDYILAEGPGKFKIVDITQRTSSSGYPQLQFKFDGTDFSGKHGILFDYFCDPKHMPSDNAKKYMAHKIHSLFCAIGHEEWYGKRDITSQDFEGEAIDLVVKNRVDDKGKQRSYIKEFLPRQKEEMCAEAKEFFKDVPDDDIPF